MAESLLQQVAQGDRSAAEACVKKYSRLVWSLASRRLRTESDIEDVIQETFINLWKSAHRFDPKRAQESTFVAMVARRRIVDRLRAQSDVQTVEITEGAWAVPEVAEVRVDSHRAALAIGELSEERRKVLWLAIAQGMSHSEIARSTGLPLGTVKSHFRRGLQEVRERLQDRESLPSSTETEAP